MKSIQTLLIAASVLLIGSPTANAQMSDLFTYDRQAVELIMVQNDEVTPADASPFLPERDSTPSRFFGPLISLSAGCLLGAGIAYGSLLIILYMIDVNVTGVLPFLGAGLGIVACYVAPTYISSVVSKNPVNPLYTCLGTIAGTGLCGLLFLLME